MREARDDGGTVTGRLPLARDLVQEAPKWLAERADPADRLLVVIVEGDGVPEAVLTPWSEARAALRRAVYGVGDLSESQIAEEAARWTEFSNLDRWSVDANGRPFGWGRHTETRDSCQTVSAYHLTSPDVLFMRRPT